MNRTNLAMTIGFGLAATVLSCGGPNESTTSRDAETRGSSTSDGPAHGIGAVGHDKTLTVTGPHVHDNLSIYLVHRSGDAALVPARFVTLADALEQKKVIVHETSSVNQLAIENVSDQEVFIQSGDIVRGGRQDRTIRHDLVLAVGPGKAPLDAFCVEQGRWQKRGGESAGIFAASGNSISSNSTKRAVQLDGDQGGVWRNVAQQQSRLNINVDTDLRDPASPTSLELTLENPNLKDVAAEYVTALTTAPTDQPDVVGMAFAINGQLNCAEVYSSPALFRAMWPRLLNSAAIEAVSVKDRATDRDVNPAPAETAAFLDACATAEVTLQDVSDRMQLATRDGDKHVMLESRDRSAQGGQWLHRRYLSKLEPAPAPAPAPPRGAQQRQAGGCVDAGLNAALMSSSPGERSDVILIP